MTRPWHEELFDERYLTFYADVFAEGASADEVEFIDRALALPPGASILDLGCGFGRHAIPLAQRGYRVTGFDASEHLLGVAKKMADSLGASLTWVHGDMRRLAGVAPVDACVCLYTVFGYFDDDENAAVLSRIFDVVRPGGRLLLDVDNPISILPHTPYERWDEAPHGVRRERQRYDALTARLIGERTLFPKRGGRLDLPDSSVRVYPPHELGRMLTAAGFELEQIHGSLTGAPIDWRRSRTQTWLVRRP